MKNEEVLRDADLFVLWGRSRVSHPVPGVWRATGATSADDSRPDRPTGVTVVAVLQIVLAGLLILSAAVLLLGQLGDTPGREAETARTLLLLSIVISVADIFLCLFLLRGSNIARIIVTVLFILSPILSFFQDGPSGKLIAQIALSILFVVLLYTPPANSYFAYSSAKK